MHLIDFDLSLDELTKVEGAAGLDLKVRDGKVSEVRFKITEYKRFFTRAMEGKPVTAVPQLLARICGTCSNAHLLCSIDACENTLGIEPSPQTKLLRLLTMYGLVIRDHALHLYMFSMPDIFNKDAFLDFDENDPLQHQMLHDGFGIKAAGNFLAQSVAGRSVHAMYPVVGGFIKTPDTATAAEAVKKLQAARPAALRLIEMFEKAPFHFDRQTDYMALVPEQFGFLEGEIKTSRGETITKADFGKHLEHTVLPYSQASAYQYKGRPYMVGALARLNLAKENLHQKTKDSVPEILKKFPSTDIFHNNLAQAVEILHAIDHAVEILTANQFKPEPPIQKPPREAVGIGVVEAPRGTLYHRVELSADGKIRQGEIVVPTGQNQVNIEADIKQLVEGMLADKSKEEMAFEIEKLIRAYDPCMSCGAHFLKVRWS